MRILELVVLTSLVSAAACSSGPSKEESFQIFGAATTAMISAQARAVADAEGSALQAPAELVLDFTGPCTLGGSLGVTGSYDSSGTGERAAFDLTTSFDGCKEAQGTLDGSLRWTSVIEAGGFSATMRGDLDWTSAGGDSASCDLELSIAVTEDTVSYSGHVCGYSLSELGPGLGR